MSATPSPSVSATTGSVFSTGAATASGAGSVTGTGSLTGAGANAPESPTVTSEGEISVTLYVPSGPRSDMPEPPLTVPGAAEASPGPRAAASPLVAEISPIVPGGGA